eukprot:m.141439 g.141439  ORF g.141439 m.141439 type:complete len:449 (-) comp30190_c0_seq1:67-1413(-)
MKLRSVMYTYEGDEEDDCQLLINAENDLDDLAHEPSQPPSHFKANWLAFFLMGTINNLPYVVVSSSAKTLADNFGASNLLGIIVWANVAMGFAAKGLNTFFLSNTPFTTRIWLMIMVFAAGLLVVAFSSSFAMAICGIVLAGAACSFGEGVALGYLKLYPNMLMNAWGSGTGMAGVGGSALYLAYLAAGLDLEWSFLVTTMCLSLYLFAYHCILVKPSAQFEHKPPAPVAIGTVQEGGWTKFKRCFKLCRWMTFNLCMVYVAEYVIYSGLAAKALNPHITCEAYKVVSTCVNNSACEWKNATPSSHSTSALPAGCESTTFEGKNAYAIFSFCYQFGVLISRSSLQVIQIKRIEVLTILQTINAVLWVIQASFKTISVAWPLFAHMVFVGLLGGASYVNVFHNLLTSKRIKDEEREYTINLAAMFGPTLGITLSALVILAMDNTFLKNA